MCAKRFRVAFSFAGEKRDFVADVAAILAEKFGEDSILFDKYHEAEFARYNLGTYLPKLYSENSDLIVPVLCPAYNHKRWTGWEWDQIFGLLTKTDGHRVMPCRFERAGADGLSPSTGFIELDDKTPQQVANLILERLALNEGYPRDYFKEAVGNTTQFLSDTQQPKHVDLGLVASSVPQSNLQSNNPVAQSVTVEPLERKGFWARTGPDAKAARIAGGIVILGITILIGIRQTPSPKPLAERVLAKWKSDHESDFPRIGEPGGVKGPFREVWFQFYENGECLVFTNGDPDTLLFNRSTCKWRKKAAPGPIVANYVHSPSGAITDNLPQPGNIDMLLKDVPDEADRQDYHRLIGNWSLSGGTGTVYLREQLNHEFRIPQNVETRIADAMYIPGYSYDLVVNVINRPTDLPEDPINRHRDTPIYNKVRAVLVLFHKPGVHDEGTFEKHAVRVNPE